MKIEKKCWPEMFQKILSGEKTYDLRLADFEIKEGDILVLKEWNPETKQYTGRVLEKKAGYICKTKEQEFFSEEDLQKYGFQIISLNDYSGELKYI